MEHRRMTEGEIRVVLEVLLFRKAGIPFGQVNIEPPEHEAETTLLASSLAGLTVPEACDRFEALHPTLTSEWAKVDPRALHETYGFRETPTVQTVLDFVNIHAAGMSDNYPDWVSDLPEGVASVSIHGPMVTISAGPKGVSDRDQVQPVKMPVFIEFANRKRAMDFAILLGVVFGVEPYPWKDDVEDQGENRE